MMNWVAIPFSTMSIKDGAESNLSKIKILEK